MQPRQKPKSEAFQTPADRRWNRGSRRCRCSLPRLEGTVRSRPVNLLDSRRRVRSAAVAELDIPRIEGPAVRGGPETAHSAGVGAPDLSGSSGDLSGFLVGACGDGEQERAEKREKASARARNDEPDNKGTSPTERLQRWSWHPREWVDRDCGVEQESDGEERWHDELHPRYGHLPTSRRSLGQFARSLAPRELNLFLSSSLHLITKPRPRENTMAPSAIPGSSRPSPRQATTSLADAAGTCHTPGRTAATESRRSSMPEIGVPHLEVAHPDRLPRNRDDDAREVGSVSESGARIHCRGGMT